MPEITKDEYRRRVTAFLAEYASAYTSYERDYIERCATVGLNSKSLTDIMRQIYDEVGLLRPEQDIYAGFLEIIEDNFDLDCNIIEVGGGLIPSLAKRIALKQSKGTITVYDPRLINTKSGQSNLILNKEYFTKHTPLTGTDLLIGFMPCEATPIILDSACKNKVPFAVALCEGGMRTGYEFLEDDDEWLGTMQYIARSGLEDTGYGEFRKASLTQYNDPYPVIYSKIKKS